MRRLPEPARRIEQFSKILERYRGPEELVLSEPYVKVFIEPFGDDLTFDRATAFWVCGETYMDVRTEEPSRRMQKCGWVCIGGVKGSRERVWRKSFPFPWGVWELSLA